MQEQKEKEIRDRRAIEAVRKGYMGGSGKFGIIAKYLGKPMTYHSTGDYNPLPDVYAPIIEDQFWDGRAESIQARIPYSDGPSEEPTGGEWRTNRDYVRSMVTTTDFGWHFDGLSSGMHLEVKYDFDMREISVYYQGYLVYLEKEDNLEAFVPNDEWESKIEMLYRTANKRERKSVVEEKQEKVKQVKTNKLNWIEQMKSRWGF